MRFGFYPAASPRGGKALRPPLGLQPGSPQTFWNACVSGQFLPTYSANACQVGWRQRVQLRTDAAVQHLFVLFAPVVEESPLRVHGPRNVHWYLPTLPDGPAKRRRQGAAAVQEAKQWLRRREVLAASAVTAIHHNSATICVLCVIAVAEAALPSSAEQGAAPARGFGLAIYTTSDFTFLSRFA